jgi:hypothetical protein
MRIVSSACTTRLSLNVTSGAALSSMLIARSDG